jgi:hypothetical protein
MAHGEFTILIIFKKKFECLMSWKYKFVYLKIRGKWKTQTLNL